MHAYRPIRPRYAFFSRVKERKCGKLVRQEEEVGISSMNSFDRRHWQSTHSIQDVEFVDGKDFSFSTQLETNRVAKIVFKTGENWNRIAE